jgi:hypothetical protein
VVSGGRPVGEFPEYLLVQWAAGGRVDPNDLFWRSGMTAAVPAHTLSPFAKYFQHPPDAGQQHDAGSRRVSAAPPRLGDDSAMRWILPVGRSPWAIAAGYLGLFSVLGIFGPLAIVSGLLAIRQINGNPRLHGMGRALFGIIAGSLGTLGLVVLLASH